MNLNNPRLNDFCGSEFWNLTRTWFTDDPDFTICFEKTVLVWIPCAFLWVFALFEIFFIRQSKDRDIPWNWKNGFKLMFTAGIIILCGCDWIVGSTSSARPAVDVYQPVLKLVTFILAASLAIYNKNYGRQASPTLFLFWFIAAVCGAFQFRTLIREAQTEGAPSDYYSYLSYLIYYPLVVAMFLLNCFGEGTPRVYSYAYAKKKNPEHSASYLSQLTWVFFDRMMYKGFRRPLEQKDMPDLRPDDSASAIIPIFEKHFNKTKAKVERYNEKHVSFQNGSAKINGVTQGRRKKPKVSSVMPAVAKSFWIPFVIGSSLKIVSDVLQFASPQLLGMLIAFTGSGDPQWKGILYAVSMFLVAITQTFLNNQHFNQLFMCGLRVRTALTAAIYRKALRVSNAARKEKTVGEIVNLMAVDASKFQEMTMFVNLLWSAPLQILLAVYFLWQELGPSILAGVGVMICLIPLNAFIVGKSKALQIKQMKDKDERVKLMNEILNGIKILKLYAWEPSFEEQIKKIRRKEIKTLRAASYLHAGMMFIWNCAPFMVSCVTFATYVLIDEKNILDASKAFVSLSLFNILRMPMSFLPNVVTQLVQLNVSIKRMNNFLCSEELDDSSVTHNNMETDPVIVENGSFAWEEEPILKNINIRVPRGSLTAIVGSVGAGKSSLISALLGEMEKLSGRVNTLGSIAYVPQQAWIQNASLKENILFGKELDTKRYNKVIEACALRPDFKMLAAGDETEIGEKGVNLSGGQKQRISLARAVYADLDLYLFDDPLSAVDAHVGKHIFEHVLAPGGLLENKTRVLVTHGITYLPKTDKIFVLDHGEVSEEGTYRELLEKKGAFSDFLMQHITQQDDVEELDQIEDLVKGSSLAEEVKRTITRQRSRISESNASDEGDGLVRSLSKESLASNRSHKRKPSRVELPKVRPEKRSGGKGKEAGKGKLIETEKMERGNVKWSVYTYYLKSLTLAMILLNLLFNTSFQGFGIGTNIWLGLWSEDPNMVVDGEVDTGKRDMYLSVYAAMGIGQAISIFVANICFSRGTMIAATKLHHLVLHNVMRLPNAFFDVTPSGRILSRFSSDILGVDLRLPMNFSVFFMNSIKVVGTMAVISYTTPLFIAVIIPLSIFYMFMQRYYVATSRQLKRLESVSRSPIYTHFGESISGAAVIRAYKQEDRFIKDSEQRVDANQMTVYPSNSSNRWLGVRLEMLGNMIILFSALFAVLGSGLAPSLVGLSVSYSLTITQTLNFLVRMVSDVETNIVCVERIKEYSEIEQEAPWDIPNKRPDKSWPTEGALEFKNYEVRYRPELDLVLRGLDISVKGGEKIGIVGRTGAGKSSLTLALFRLIEAAGGRIEIDGVNIAEIGLHSLRSRLTIIPQDAILFSGSLRMNLDPFDTHSDEEVWKVLELAHLKEFAKTLPAGLSHAITEGGDNLSVGQRQLICLGRALLRKTKILILDEATAAVDLETDDLIQKTIRTEFATSTVLTIAHRLNTIMDSDRVLVLDQGKIAEFDSPANLLEKKDSIFHGMCKDSGLVS